MRMQRMRKNRANPDKWIIPDEVDRIFEKTFFANQGRKTYLQKKARRGRELQPGCIRRKTKEDKEEYLLVDGYNIIFAWPELKDLAKENMDSAKSRLLHYLSKYKSVENINVIVVFDAYRVQGHPEEVIEYDN